jgi:hypothetical protein
MRRASARGRVGSALCQAVGPFCAHHQLARAAGARGARARQRVSSGRAVMGSHAVVVRSADVTHASLHVRVPTFARLDIWPVALLYAALLAARVTGCGVRAVAWRVHAHAALWADARRVRLGAARSTLTGVPLAVAAGVLVTAHALLVLCAHWFVPVAAALRCWPQPAATRATLVKARTP